jgi:hypothetical protein
MTVGIFTAGGRLQFMKIRSMHFRNLLALSALTSLLRLGTPASAQTVPAQGNTSVQDNDITRQELARFDQFLDGHRYIAEELRKDPSLIDSREYMQNHPDLQAFLQDHPRVREEIKENPDAFMKREERFDRHEDARDRDKDRGDRDRDANRDDRDASNGDRDRDVNRGDQDSNRDHDRNANGVDRDANRGDRDRDATGAKQDQDSDRADRDRDATHGDRDRDTTRGELASFDKFLDSHREIAEQVRKNPSLVDNPEFVKSHPELQTYLQQHPGVREEIKENPNAFMRQEDRFDRREDARDRDVNREELARFDNFLDSHREIAEQLRKDPSLVDNHEFVKNHPALQAFLQQHPGVSDELKENPNAFMREEDRFDRREDRMGMDRDASHERMAKFGEFLGSHSNISEQLSKDPSLVKNEEFMANHPELKEFLNAHPDVQQEMMANPQNFIKSAQQFTHNPTSGGKPPAPMPDAKPKP